MGPLIIDLLEASPRAKNTMTVVLRTSRKTATIKSEPFGLMHGLDG